MSLEKVIVALDNMGKDQVIRFLDQKENTLPFVKLGLEMFCLEGPQFVREINERFNKKIFLDLKLHDIPNTVAKSIRSLEGLPIEFLTIHLSGGREMILKALEAQKQYLPNTKLLGVSYLTSLDETDFNDLHGLSKEEIPMAFNRLFQLALETKIQGIVCSSHEVSLVKELENNSEHQLIKVCPGIRFEDEIKAGAIQDQKRVLSPKDAFQNGATYLVMGRSLNSTDKLAQRIQQLAEI